MSKTVMTGGGTGGQATATTVFVSMVSPLPLGEGQGEGGQEVAEYEANAAATDPLRKYVYSGDYIDEPVLLVDRTAVGSVGTGSDEKFYYHQNNLYSVAALTDQSGSVVERYAYSAYGEPVFLDSAGQLLGTQGSTVGNDYLYTARRLDGESGLMYYRARMYSPRLGRFIGRDPIGYFQPDKANKSGIRLNILAHGNDSDSTDTLEDDGNVKSISAKINDFNLYRYVHNRPLDLLDPAGLFPCQGIRVRAQRVLGIWGCPKVRGEKAWGPYPASAKFADGKVASWKECLNPCDKMDCPEGKCCIGVQRTMPPNELGTVYSFPTCVCKDQKKAGDKDAK